MFSLLSLLLFLPLSLLIRCHNVRIHLSNVYRRLTSCTRPPLNVFLYPQACLVKDGQAARAPLVGLETQEHQGDQVIQVPLDQLDPQDTVTRTPAWGTTSEVNTIQLLFKRWYTSL